MSELNRFSRNSFFLTISYFLRFGAGILVTVLVAKHVTQEDFGRLAFALTLATFFGVAADFGLPALTVRDVARDSSLASRYYRNIFTLKCVFSIIAFAAVVIFVNAFGYPPETKRVVYPIAAFMFIASLGTYHYFLFRGLERMDIDAAAALTYNASLIVFVLGALLLAGGGYPIPIGRVTTGYLAAGIVATILIVLIFGRKAGGLRLSIEPKFWKGLLKESSFLGFYAMLGLIYMQIDTLMLSKLWQPDPERQMALYQAPVKLLSAAVMIVGIVINVFMPMLSRRFMGPREGFKSLVHTLNRMGVTIMAPLAVFAFAFSDQIIEFLFRPEYAQSGHILMVLSVAYFVWFSPPYGVVFVTMGKQRINFFVSLACAATNVVLNLIFIPRYGAIAAAATTLATYLLMKGLYLYFCHKHLGSVFINRRFAIAVALCVALAVGLRLAALHVVPAGVIFCAVYGSLSYLFIFSAAEKRLCLRLVGLRREETTT